MFYHSRNNNGNADNRREIRVRRIKKIVGITMFLSSSPSFFLSYSLHFQSFFSNFPLLVFFYTSFCLCMLPLLPSFSPICYASRKSVFWISCVSTTVRPTHCFLTKYYSSLFFSSISCLLFFSPLSPPLFFFPAAVVLLVFVSFLSSFVLSSCSLCWFISASFLQVLIFFFNP